MTALRTRFAPSPTGSLHVGGVRTSLYCLLVARATVGRFLLRIEDTDRVRSTEEAAAGILRDLQWLGLQWDEGPIVSGPHAPYYQSQRLELYREHAARLVAEGKAYEAWESPAELDAERKEAEAKKENYRFRRRVYTAEQVAAWRAEGRLPVVRLLAPGHAVTVADRVLGDVTVEADGLDDFVILKADGFPTYHFAVVIDDHFMQVELVLRGQEHLMNTHKHLLLYEAFGWTPPQHGHLPLIFNPTGTKMSKRDKARVARETARALAKSSGKDGKDWSWLATEARVDPVELAGFMDKKSDGVATAEAIARVTGAELPRIEVQDYRVGGYVPEAIVNYLCLLGWSPGDDREVLTFDEMVAAFTVDRVQKTPARFDYDKLLWFNAEYIKSLPEDQLLRRLRQWLEVVDSPIRALTEAQQRHLLRMYRPRARTFVDLQRLAGFLFRRPTQWDAKQVDKHVAKDGGWDRLAALRAALAGQAELTTTSVQGALQGLCDASGLPIGKFAQPARVAVSGDGVSPELADTLAFLGRDEVLARFDAFLATGPGGRA
jgi:glutamyl/glutaminyl-tRNA synthetase